MFDAHLVILDFSTPGITGAECLHPTLRNYRASYRVETYPVSCRALVCLEHVSSRARSGYLEPGEDNDRSVRLMRP